MVWGSGCVCCVRAVGAPFTLGIGAHPLIARLRQHVVPPQPPQLFSIEAPSKLPSRGAFLLSASSQLCKCAFQSKPQLRWSSVGLWSSRPVPAARREATVPNNKSPLTPCQGCSRFPVGHLKILLKSPRKAGLGVVPGSLESASLGITRPVHSRKLASPICLKNSEFLESALPIVVALRS